LSSQQNTRAGNRRQLLIESLTMSPREVPDRPLDFRHPSAAVPASCQVGMNLSSAPGREFAIRGLKQV
jgi:hypothetical protein